MKYVFIVGSPRSGTTWLQLLLSQHAVVKTAQETALFTGYISPLYRRWRSEGWSTRKKGLSALLSEKEFDGLCREFARSVLGRIDASDEAEVILEKTPNHISSARLIHRLFPEAYFIHVVRDPRDVSLSLKAASQSWGRQWASSSELENARRWVSDTTHGRDIVNFSDRYHEIRYEDLNSESGSHILTEVFCFLGIEVDEQFCNKSIDACSIKNIQGSKLGLCTKHIVDSDPESFYRQGKSFAWKNEMDARNVLLIEYVAAKQMRAFGYNVINDNQNVTNKARIRSRVVLDKVQRRLTSLLVRNTR